MRKKPFGEWRAKRLSVLHPALLSNMGPNRNLVTFRTSLFDSASLNLCMEICTLLLFLILLLLFGDFSNKHLLTYLCQRHQIHHYFLMSVFSFIKPILCAVYFVEGYVSSYFALNDWILARKNIFKMSFNKSNRKKNNDKWNFSPTLVIILCNKTNEYQFSFPQIPQTIVYRHEQQ